MKQRTLFVRLLLLIIMAIVIVGVVIGVAFMRISDPVFTKAKANEILPRAEAVVNYYKQYVGGMLDLREMQAAISVSGTLSNAQLQIYDASGSLVIFSLDQSSDFFYRADSFEMRSVSLPIALESMRINANITRTTTDSSRRFEYMVVASPVVQDTAVTGCVVLISPMDVVRYPLQRLYWVLLASCIVAIVLMLIPLSYFLQRMVKPLAQMNVVALSMAKGDFSQRADESTRGEIGELAHSVNHLAEQLGQTVQALMLERNRLHHILNGLSDGILALDENGDLLHTNPALFSLFDMNRLSDVVGSLDPALVADIKAVAESGTPLLRDIGSGSRILHMIATPIIDDKGIRRGVVTLFHDITESERLEQTRREYVANVSHELRTPLSAVRGLAEALSDGLITTQEDRNRYYGHILRECMRLSRLIEDLLELSRLQSGNIALKKQTVDLPQLLTDIRTRYETLSDDLGIGFTVDCTQACPAVLANADRIAQVMVILLDNAFKFSDEGGQVTVRVVCGEQKVTVCVEDNGSGIEKDDLPHVFERFYKAEKAHSGNGTGLGLSIANEVITLMGETIWATSEPNAGSTFCFTLQRADV